MTKKQTVKITHEDKLAAVKVLAQLDRIGVLPGAGEVVGNVWTELETTKEPDDLQVNEGAVSRPAKPVADNCETCMYYVPQQAVPQPAGRCHRNAPNMKGFPTVYPSSWCGEHTLDPQFLNF